MTRFLWITVYIGLLICRRHGREADAFHRYSMDSHTDRNTFHALTEMTRSMHVAMPTQNLAHNNPSGGSFCPPPPLPRSRPLQSTLPSTILNHIQQCLVMQAGTIQQTPPVSMVQAVSRTLVEVSILPLGYKVANLWSRQPSQATTCSRCSRRSSKSSMADAMMNFGLQVDKARFCQMFDHWKQENGESIAMFEQGLHSLYRDAWPDSDPRSPEAESTLQRHFMNGVRVSCLQ